MLLKVGDQRPEQVWVRAKETPRPGRGVDILLHPHVNRIDHTLTLQAELPNGESFTITAFLAKAPRQAANEALYTVLGEEKVVGDVLVVKRSEEEPKTYESLGDEEWGLVFTILQENHFMF